MPTTDPRWPRIRAALLAVALAYFGVIALPLPKALGEKQVRGAKFDAELDRWHGVLASAGVPISREGLQTLVLEGSQSVGGARAALIDLASPMWRLTGMGQAFYVFSAADRTPTRWVVEGRAGESWRTLYRAQDDDADWMEPHIRYRRTRATLELGGRRAERVREWLAERAFEDFPELEEVRVVQERLRTGSPGEDLAKPPKSRTWTYAGPAATGGS
jgi:hypothetical protein